ncbi:MAG: undecaprenyl-diphosphate phosphatase [Janthinobacterium lividum]
MHFWQAALLGIVEGLTEFLPVSSTGHLTIVERLLGMRVDDAGTTAFTAIIQVGAIIAVIVYFRSDIARLISAFVRGLRSPETRDSVDYRLAWCVILGSIPVGVVGFLARDVVSGSLRSLWVVAAALIGWSAVMVFAERFSARRARTRGEQELTLRDAMWIGVLQCVALVPGVSRSGATISTGLLRGLDRVTATRVSFFLSVPALTAAGAYEALSAGKDVSASVGWGPTLLGTLVSLVVAYAAIAWLLRFVAQHPISVFAGYRIALGVVLVVLLGVGAVTPV